MYPFQVQHLDINKLLKQWRWKFEGELQLIARSAFGDLILGDRDGHIFKLDVGDGSYERIAGSYQEFQAATLEKQGEWLAMQHAAAAAEGGLNPGPEECIGFKIPIVFAESGFAGNAYIANLYECVSFLGDMHRQIAEVPDGGAVRFKFTK